MEHGFIYSTSNGCRYGDFSKYNALTQENWADFEAFKMSADRSMYDFVSLFLN